MVHTVTENTLPPDIIQKIVNIVNDENSDLLTENITNKINIDINVEHYIKDAIDKGFGFSLPIDIPITIFFGDTQEHTDHEANIEKKIYYHLYT